MRRVGNREEVWHGHAHHTSGGLTRSDLKLNSSGKIVSRRASERARSSNHLGMHKKQRGAGVLGDIGTGLAAAAPIAALTGVGAAAAPFLGAAGTAAKFVDDLL